MSRCRSCEAEVLWTMTEHGKRMPLDAEPYDGPEPSGLFVLRGEGDTPQAVAATPESFPGEPLFRSHFATCPDANDWRSR